jgi:hypothetical protein
MLDGLTFQPMFKLKKALWHLIGLYNPKSDIMIAAILTAAGLLSFALLFKTIDFFEKI